MIPRQQDNGHADGEHGAREAAAREDAEGALAI